MTASFTAKPITQMFFNMYLKDISCNEKKYKPSCKIINHKAIAKISGFTLKKKRLTDQP